MITFILNHAPYGTEKSYNALRLALALLKRKEPLRVFMIDDGVFNAVKGQKTPDGYYNIERMMSSLIRRGHDVHT